MTDIEKTACRYAWSYPIIDIGRAELRNCCRTPYNKLNEKDWLMGTDIFKNLETIRQVKRDLLMGIKTEKCRTCWTSENYGIKSPRSGFEDFVIFLKAVKWQHISTDEIKQKLYNLTQEEIDELVNLENPEHVEISLSTTCDLKCVYCSHVFSTQWATEKLKYGEIDASELPKNDNEFYEKIWWEWFDKVASNTVHKISFVGGEPLINEKFYEYVEKLIEYYDKHKKRKLHIFVATNMNTPKKFFDKLSVIIEKIADSKFVSIALGISFESLGEKNSFIRTNANWNIFNNNLTDILNVIKTKDIKKVKANIVIMPAINVLSVSSLPEYLNYIIALRGQYDRYIRISSTHVTYPIRYSPFILTNDFTKYIDQSIQTLMKSEWYSELAEKEPGSWIGFANYLKTIKSSILNETTFEIIQARKEFVNDIKKLSLRRNLNFHKTFPELVEFYNYCSNYS